MEQIEFNVLLAEELGIETRRVDDLNLAVVATFPQDGFFVRDDSHTLDDVGLFAIFTELYSTGGEAFSLVQFDVFGFHNFMLFLYYAQMRVFGLLLFGFIFRCRLVGRFGRVAESAADDLPRQLSLGCGVA